MLPVRIWPLSSSVSFPLPSPGAFPARTAPPMLILFLLPALLGGILAGRGRAGNAATLRESSWDPRPASVSPQNRAFSIPGDVMEIPVDRGLDEAHVMNIVC